MSMENAAEERLMELTREISEVKKLLEMFFWTDPKSIMMRGALKELEAERDSLIKRLAWKVAI